MVVTLCHISMSQPVGPLNFVLYTPSKDLHRLEGLIFEHKAHNDWTCCLWTHNEAQKHCSLWPQQACKACLQHMPFQKGATHLDVLPQHVHAQRLYEVDV